MADIIFFERHEADFDEHETPAEKCVRIPAGFEGERDVVETTKKIFAIYEQ